MSESLAGKAASYDHYIEEFVADPYEFWASLRRDLPVARSENYGGFYLVSRYDDVCQVAHDAATYSSAQGIAIPALPFPPLIPLEVDPPRHREYRRIINPGLSPASAAAWEPQVRAMAVELIEPILGQSSFDLCREFAAPFPQWVTLRLIGFPDSDRDTMGQWADNVVRLRGIDDERMGTAAMLLMGRIVEFMEERRGAPRRDDMISALLDAEIDGRPLEDDEILLTVALLLFGGLETTTSVIAGAMLHLAAHPDDRRRLLDDPGLMDTAVDEFIRWTSPVQGMRRTVTKDSTVGGCPVREGDWLFLLWGSANRDERTFAQPDDVVLDRRPNHHVGFGLGPHRCAGAHFGKLMVKVALEELLGRLGDFSLEDPAKLVWVGADTRGLRALPLVRTAVSATTG